MTLMRPTMQGRKGFDPTGYGPGIMSPFGYSPGYRGGKVHHNGEDWFWLGKASADRLGISTEQSKRVYPVVNGRVHHIDDVALGLGLWQQIDKSHRFYWWHLRDREPAGTYTTGQSIGRMGSTGTAGGDDEHLHGEVRRAPYRTSDRIDPEPFFADLDLSGDDSTPIEEEEDMKPKNYADKSTMPGGKFGAGTKCMSIWPSGAIQEYVIGGKSRPEELSLLMYDIAGGPNGGSHEALEPVAYASIRDAHLALRGGGAADAGFTSQDRARLEAVPTAEQNAAAARAAIVAKP